LWWDTVQQQLRQGQTAAALSLLQQLQQEAADQFVTHDDTSVTTDRLIEGLLAQLPAADRRAWETAIAPHALALWERWQRERDLAALRRLCCSYRTTDAGLWAWRTLAALNRDQGRLLHAASAYREVLRHPRASRQDRASALLALGALAQARGQRAEVEALWREHAPDLANVSVARGEETVPVARVFAEWLAHPSPKPAATPGVLSEPWQQAWGLPEDLLPLWQSSAPEYRASGAWPLPAIEPLHTGDLLLFRSLMQIVAVDAARGELRWRSSPQPEYDWLRTNPGLLDNRSFRSVFVEQLYRRCLADSVLGRLTTDGRAVFAIEDTRGLGAGSTNGQPPNWPPRQNVGAGEARTNLLTAYRLSTGELAWRIGGASAGPTYALAGVFFCGPPTPVDDLLYVLAQQGNELHLLSLFADRGELHRQLPLGDTPRPLSEDPLRQRVACPVTLGDNLLLCPTAAGALIAVDLTTHSPQWAFRYPVELRLRTDADRGPQTVTARDAWWDGWRDIRVCRAGQIVVFASPETNHLHALDADSGRLLWSVPRAGGLLLVGVVNDAVVIAEPTGLRAHRLTTGEVLWRASIGELSGRPVIAGDEITVPAEPHGLVVVRLTDGGWSPISNAYARPLGNLVHHAGSWWAASVTTVQGLGDGQGGLRQRPLDRAVRRQMLLADLAARPDRWSAWQTELAELAETPAQRIELELALVRAAQAAGDSLAAARHLLALAEKVSREDVVQEFSPRRHIRADLAVLGAWDDLERHAAPSVRSDLQRLLDESWQSACASSDPFTVQRWREFWQPHSFARQAKVLTHPRVYLGQPMAAVELALLSAGNLADQPTLLWHLAEELSRAGFHRDAADYRNLLRHRFAGAVLPDGRTIGTALREFPPSRSRGDPWPLVEPEIEPQSGQILDNVHHAAVPLDVESTPLFERLDVTIDRQGRRLRFSGGGQRGVWELALPQSTSPWRHAPEMVYGWGRGRLLLIRVGTELFAVTPFDERGEPAARLLWTHDLGRTVPPEQIAIFLPPVNSAWHEDGLRLLDAFGLPVGQVGPVRAAYLCFRQNARLISVETLTGRRRWERYDLPADAILTGDDHTIVWWSPSEQRVEWLRASDAAALGQRSWTVSPEDVVLLRDRRVWHWQRGPAPRLVCADLVSGRTLWSRDIAAGSLPVRLDGETLGVVDPRGALHVWSAEEGAPLSEPLSVMLPATIDRVVVSRDAERWYVGFSERTAQQAALRMNQIRQGYRAPIVTGTLYAIDRSTAMVCWQIELDREGWPLDQPRSLPILVQAYKALPAANAGGNVPQAVPTTLRLRDKRTGRDVLYRDDLRSVPYVTCMGDPDRGVLDVLLEREMFRLRYQPAPPAPPLPEQ
jgi:outer membrane protein assembly factor BamB